MAFRRVLGVAWSLALVGFVVGGARGAWVVFRRPFVREFEVGLGSPAAERWLATAQRAAIDGVGFGLVALALGLVALALARTPPFRSTSPGGSGRGFARALLLLAGAVWAWSTSGAWIAEEALAFLRPGEIAVVSAGGVLLAFLGLWLLDAIARRLPWARPGRATETSACLVLLALAADALALHLLTERGLAWRSASGLAQLVLPLVAAVGLAPLLGRLAGPALAAVGARLGAGRLAPRGLRAGLSAALAVTVLAVLPGLRLSAAPSTPSYSRMNARPGAQGPNVVLVLIDTLRADHLGCYGYPRPTSPFIDSLAQSGVRCADPMAPASWTKPSTGTILTGLAPSRHGGLHLGSRLRLPEGERTLAERMRDSGRVTAGFVSNPQIRSVFEFDRGFDQYGDELVEDTLALASLRESYLGRLLTTLTRNKFNWYNKSGAGAINEHVFAWLEANHQAPFFLYVHYIDPHVPYSPPPEHERAFRQDHGFPLFNERKRLVGMDLYDAEIRGIDDALAELAGELRRHGVWDDTLFVVVSDHGEEFYEHGLLGHGFSLYQEVLRVPLVLSGPGVPAGGVVEQPVGLVDLAATLLDLAGTGIEVQGDGRSFAPLVRGLEPEEPRTLFLESEFGQDDSDRRAFALSGVRRGRWKLVLTARNRYFPPQDPRYGAEALYDLESDPDESVNLARDEAQRERMGELLESLREHAAFLEETGFRGGGAPLLSPELEASLRALGY